MITVPIDDLEGLLKTLEGFFGPDVFAEAQNSERRIRELAVHGAALKTVLNKQRSQEAAAKSIFDATEAQLDEADKENLQEMLDNDVHDATSNEGSDVNNAGREEQILLLVRELGEDEVRRRLREGFEGRLNV